jgi:hypothetical protein
MNKVYILDTSWLVEFYKLPDHHEVNRSKSVLAEFKSATQLGASFILPLAVVFEYCNHIAQIKNGTLRIKFATQFANDVRSSRNNVIPYLIMPAADLPEIDVDLDLFASTYAAQGIGLVDIQIERLAKDWSTKRGRLVHIWTFDDALKAREPNAET